jgi:hypothetical protein
MTTQTKLASTGVDLILKIGTALLISFAATLVLVHAEVYFARSLIVFWSQMFGQTLMYVRFEGECVEKLDCS